MKDIKSDTMSVHNKEDVPYVTFKKFEQYPAIVHGFSTKHGGVSKGYLESLNLGFNRGDLEENVLANYHLICNAIDVPYDSLVRSNQVHGILISKVTAKDKGKGIGNIPDIGDVDGLYTDEKGITLVTHFADCVPLFFYEPNKGIIGLAHAGWRGTVDKIASNMILKWQEEYDIAPKDIIVGIGPSIGSCCFEVDTDVAKEFVEINNGDGKVIKKMKNGKYHIDLWNANMQILLSVGIESNNICVTDLCTKCHSDIFFSHRATKGKRGTLGAFLMMK